MAEIGPVTLEGRVVKLVPLEERHGDDLAKIADDPSIWRYIPLSLETREDVEAWVQHALNGAKSGRIISFVTIEKATGTVVGATSFRDIEPDHHTAEIGGTWIGLRWQRTAINSEAKYLMLRYLFDTLGWQRAWFKTDVLNVKSQRAIERLGATREGVMRKNMIVQHGRQRDSVLYAIIDDDWPAIRTRMEAALYPNESF